jgi:hypothetical protein
MLLFTTLMFAQKVQYDKKTTVIKVAGKPYAKMIVESSGPRFPLNNNFTFTDLDGNEIMYMKINSIETHDKSDNLVSERFGYEIIFVGPYPKETGFRYNTIGAKGAAKFFVKNKLLKDGQLDEKAKAILLSKYKLSL